MSLSSAQLRRWPRPAARQGRVVRGHSARVPRLRHPPSLFPRAQRTFPRMARGLCVWGGGARACVEVFGVCVCVRVCLCARSLFRQAVCVCLRHCGGGWLPRVRVRRMRSDAVYATARRCSDPRELLFATELRPDPPPYPRCCVVHVMVGRWLLPRAGVCGGGVCGCVCGCVWCVVVPLCVSVPRLCLVSGG